MADKIAQQLRTNVEKLGARLSENLSGEFKRVLFLDSNMSTRVRSRRLLEDGLRGLSTIGFDYR